MGPSVVPETEALAGLVAEAEPVDPALGQRPNRGAGVDVAGPLADDVAGRIEQLQALRDELSEATDTTGVDAAIASLPPSASAPPRMDSGDPNPERLGAIEVEAAR